MKSVYVVIKSVLQKLSPAQALLIGALSLFIAQTLPRLLSYGVFFDGLTYSSLARNLAEGKGSFWNLYYTDTLYPRFIEHPPLAFFPQSLVFKVLGDAFFIETIYGFILGIVSLWILHAIWQQLQRKDIKLSGSFSPVLMFGLYPIVSWVYANNMIENTLTLFILLSSYFFIRAMLELRSSSKVLLLIAGSLFLFAAALCKGPVALFPLVIPFVWYLVYHDERLHRTIVFTLFIIIMLGVFALICILPFREAVQFFTDYFQNQVMRSLSGQREVADSKFIIFKRFFFESLVSVGVAMVILLSVRKPLRVRKNKTLLFCFLIALSGSLPFGLIPKQMGWYLIPSLPFYAMALAALFSEPFTKLEEILAVKEKLKKGIVLAAVLLLTFSTVLMVTEYKKVRKEKDFFKDLVVDRFPFEERSIISTYPAELYEKWSMIANLQRTFKVSVSKELGCRYLITTADYEKDSLLNTQYRKIHPKRNSYFSVFEKK